MQVKSHRTALCPFIHPGGGWGRDINIPLLATIKEIPSYAKFLKDLCTVKRKLGVNKDAFMTEQSTYLIWNNLPPKYKDPGSPTISIVAGNSKL